MDPFVCSGINKAFVILNRQQLESQSKSFSLAEPHVLLMKIFCIFYLCMKGILYTVLIQRQKFTEPKLQGLFSTLALWYVSNLFISLKIRDFQPPQSFDKKGRIWACLLNHILMSVFPCDTSLIVKKNVTTNARDNQPLSNFSVQKSRQKKYHKCILIEEIMLNLSLVITTGTSMSRRRKRHQFLLSLWCIQCKTITKDKAPMPSLTFK